MPGTGSLIGGLGYLAVGPETTFKTYSTCTAGLPFLSCSLKTTQEHKIIEQIDRSRTYSAKTTTTRRVEGEFEFHPCVESTALVYLLQNAFGGTISSATATGDTAGASSFEHTLDIGNFDQARPSVCLNQRKGDSLTGKVFEYNGVRVNEFMFSAELDEALRATVGVIGVDSTVTSNDVASALTTSSFEPLSFVAGRVSIENSLASLTSSSFWHVQSVELGLSNSLKNDEVAGRIGSEVLDVLPPGMVAFTFNMTMRYDTQTAFDAMKAGTLLAGQFEFLGSTMSGSSLRKSLKLTMPRIFIVDAGDPEIGGPDEVLTSQVTAQILLDNSSATGYAMRAVIRNQVASY
ncbi:MAG: hypothetical protein C4586_05920 [Anaerolineaceae bacterium]|nr:MAG: hypothetical protein C4586_05920 [Anaerolineaceae bacterium]